MIKKRGTGYQVVSHTGKALSRVYRTRGEAVKRLAEVDYFKATKGKKR